MSDVYMKTSWDVSWGLISQCVTTFSGEMISEKDRCKECRGKKVVNETKILEVHVDKGMRNEQKIPFRGEGDQLVSVFFMIFLFLCIILVQLNSDLVWVVL